MSGMTEREKKKRDEQNLKALQEVLALPGNDTCADCGARGPRWASANLGVFLCIRCGGAHRKLGTHISKIKSVTLDSWTEAQIQVLRDWGNLKANAKYLAGGGPPVPSESDSDMETYIRNKYEKRIYEIPGNRSRTFTDVNSSASRDTANYASQLHALSNMGFTDVSRNLAALKRSKGAVDGAVEILVSNPGPDTTPARPASPMRTSSLQAHSQAPSPSQHQQQVQAALQTALESLKNMGFDDEDANRGALRAAGGKMEAAANMLLDQRNKRMQGQQQQQGRQTPQGNAGTGSNAGFVLEPPTSSGKAANRGNRGPQQQQQQQTAGVDMFGDAGAFGAAPVAQQPTAATTAPPSQNQPFGDLFGMEEPAAPPKTGTPTPTSAAKDNIMSLFNTPPPQQQQQMMMPGPGMYNAGYGMMPQQQMYGMAPQGMMMPQMGGMQMMGGMPQQQGMMMNPQQMQQHQQQMGGFGMGQQSYVTYAPNRGN
ncbi:hypothetical protein HK104_000144, partial [Borealophlyctis nickersoniae]